MNCVGHREVAFRMQDKHIAEDISAQTLCLGTNRSHKNNISHIDASLSRQPLVKGERLVRHEVNAVINMRACLEVLLNYASVPLISCTVI